MTTSSDVAGIHRDDGHRHLGVVGSREPTASGPSRHLVARWAVVVLVLAAAALWVAAYGLPWWHFTLFAPQYPQGLTLSVSLHGLGGDAREIDMLNHYIGMKHLGEAAQFERQYALWGVALLAVVAMLAALLPGKRGWPLPAIVGIGFPVGFLADSFYWLYHFGHALDPRAPLKMKPFTPQMFGEGIIGQFHTWAEPDTGFWVALAGIGLLAVAAIVRWRVCAGCARRGDCHGVCPSLFVGPGAGLPAKAGG